MEDAFRREEYLAGPGLATAVFAALRLGRPLLLEGEPGVGKTEVARTLARIVDGPLIRLQCYEGIDAGRALYEWDYARQMLHVRALQQGEITASERVAEIYGAEFLVERPLLRAIRATGPRVLLIDELDRADDEFDAFLLELLDDYGVTVPELGRFVATTPPIVVITSNRTRELHGAVKRRCLYHWIDFPDPEREAEIIRLRAPGVGAALATSVADAVARLRAADLVRRPGAAEAIDWARALALLGVDEVRGEAAIATLGWVVKSREDEARARPILEALAHG
jgi:MoxR-like ATPase